MSNYIFTRFVFNPKMRCLTRRQMLSLYVSRGELLFTPGKPRRINQFNKFSRWLEIQRKSGRFFPATNNKRRLLHIVKILQFWFDHCCPSPSLQSSQGAPFHSCPATVVGHAPIVFGQHSRAFFGFLHGVTKQFYKY
jgi:hypothetical protein